MTVNKLDWFKILDASHNGIVVVDKEGIILVYNQAARRIFNDSKNSIIGRPFSDVRPEAWPDMSEVIRTGRPQLGRKIILREATIIANRNPIIVDGEVIGVVSVFQDISEYEKIISQLQSYQRLHHELEAIIESSDDGLYITDGEANTLRVNRSYERITGLARADLIGRNMYDLVAEKVFDHSVTLEVLKKRSKLSIMQNVMGNKQVMLTGNPILDNQGHIVFVVTNVRDITELNELRVQLENSRRVSSRFYQSLLEQEGMEHALENMIVKSESMASAVRKAIKVARVDTSAILYGESGVGKSMLARIIHQMSPRKDGPFIKINCGTIPYSLMESELFGYEEGAFTGAQTGGKAGLVEAAHGGTVFFDEIGELDMAMQVKLLEVIEDHAFIRVGGTQTVKVDARILAATNRDLGKMVRAGKFREDLFYRLNVVPIQIPPLRERNEDVPVLALNILTKSNNKQGTYKRISPQAIELLQSYDYPGNVRELFNIIERMIIMTEGSVIEASDLPSQIREAPPVSHKLATGSLTLPEAVHAFEAHMIKEVLARRKSPIRAAKELGIHHSTLWRKMTKYGLTI